MWDGVRISVTETTMIHAIGIATMARPTREG